MPSLLLSNDAPIRIYCEYSLYLQPAAPGDGFSVGV